LKKDLIRPVEPDKTRAKELLIIAERDVKTATDNFKNNNYDWTLAIAYNAMLSAGRALMAAKGYMPVAEAHHLAVVQFCAAVLPADSGDLAVVFNRYRVKRHDIVYEGTGIVGAGEAENAIKNAKLFVQKIKEKIG
jgi:uncharacterized protein (UPF0332 family)